MNSCWPLVTVRSALLGSHLTDDGAEAQGDDMVCPNHEAGKGKLALRGPDRLLGLSAHQQQKNMQNGRRQLRDKGNSHFLVNDTCLDQLLFAWLAGGISSVENYTGAPWGKCRCT